MFESNVISKPLDDMNIYELDLAIALIMKDDDFAIKDKIGNRMYFNTGGLSKIDRTCLRFL